MYTLPNATSHLDAFISVGADIQAPARRSQTDEVPPVALHSDRGVTIKGSG
jgi:hypothetical protein